MRKLWLFVVIFVFLGVLSLLGSNEAASFSTNSLMCRVGSPGTAIDSYVKIGYQRMGINLNFPIPQAPTTNFLMDTMDVKINRLDMIIGTLGISGQLNRRIGLFAEATASTTWSGSLYTEFSGIAGAGGPFGDASGWSWPTNNVRWWDINLGGKFDLSDSFAILAGFKCDRLSQKLTTPSGPAYQFFVAPVFRNDYFGDLDIRTWSPYVGVKMEDTHWRFDVLWSPWLTAYDVRLPLRIVLADSFEVYSFSSAESRYKLTASGGNLLEAYGEGKFNLFEHLGASLWLKASWLQCRGNGDEDFVDTFFGTPGTPFYDATSGSSDATSTFTRYLWAVGVTGRLFF